MGFQIRHRWNRSGKWDELRRSPRGTLVEVEVGEDSWRMFDVEHRCFAWGVMPRGWTLAGKGIGAPEDHVEGMVMGLSLMGMPTGALQVREAIYVDDPSVSRKITVWALEMIQALREEHQRRSG